MFGFSKKKMSQIEVATALAQSIVSVESSPQDVSFQEQAVGAGADIDQFKVEMFVFQVFTVGQVINRERLEGRLDSDKAESLMKEFLQAVFWRVENVEGAQSLPPNLDVETAMDQFEHRNGRYTYYLLGGDQASFDEIPKLFAKFCGVPNSEVLEQIGRSLLRSRGDSMGDWMSKLKIL